MSSLYADGIFNKNCRLYSFSLLTVIIQSYLGFFYTLDLILNDRWKEYRKSNNGIFALHIFYNKV